MLSAFKRLTVLPLTVGAARKVGVYNGTMKTIALAFGIVAFLIVGFFAFSSNGNGKEPRPEPPGTKTAVFAVACYDVGKHALDGVTGVSSVSTGWRGRSEVNEVRYDPSAVSVATLESELRRAGTYIKTVEVSP